MSTDHNMLNFQMNYSIFNDRGRIDVGGGDYVGNVSVDEDISGGETEDCGFRDTRVRAADPKDSWGLTAGKRGKE
jgi:hypothetical protein